MSFGIEKLIVYRNLANDEILKEVADILREFEADATDRDELISRIYNCINKLLAVSTENGFDNNLWQSYLTYLLVMDENPFALSCEKGRQGRKRCKLCAWRLCHTKRAFSL